MHTWCMQESYMKQEGFQSRLFSFAQQALDTWPRCSSRRRSKASIRCSRPRHPMRTRPGIKPASSWERIGQRGWAACRSLPLSPRQQANTRRGRGLYEHLADGDHMQPPAGRRHFPAISSPPATTPPPTPSLRPPAEVSFSEVLKRTLPLTVPPVAHTVLPPRVCVAVPENEATRFSFCLVQNIIPSS